MQIIYLDEHQTVQLFDVSFRVSTATVYSLGGEEPTFPRHRLFFEDSGEQRCYDVAKDVGSPVEVSKLLAFEASLVLAS